MPMEEPMAQVPPAQFVEGAAKNEFPSNYINDEKKSIADGGEAGNVVGVEEQYYDPKSEFNVLPRQMCEVTAANNWF
jgi:hypothetical protein